MKIAEKGCDVDWLLWLLFRRVGGVIIGRVILDQFTLLIKNDMVINAE